MRRKGQTVSPLSGSAQSPHYTDQKPKATARSSIAIHSDFPWTEAVTRKYTEVELVKKYNLRQLLHSFEN